MAKPPTPEKPIRLTITVTPEVHEAFSRMAEVTGMSLGRAMGDWLADTLEGAQFVTGQLAKAREAPRQVAKEMRQMLLGAVDEADDLIADLRKKGANDGRTGGAPLAGAPGRPEAASPPRLVIRGGKSPGKTLKPVPGRSTK